MTDQSSSSIRVLDVVGRPMLFSREAARKLEGVLSHELRRSENVTIDLRGARALTPSFFDELLWILEENATHDALAVTLKNAPHPLDSKFKAVATGHSLSISAADSDTWVLHKEESPV